jgi:Protein of unknown function (DUF2523)
MPFVYSLLGGLVTSTVVKAILVRVLVALGISAVTYGGVYLAGGAMVSAINSNFASLPPQFLAILTIMHIPQFLNVIFSAYAGSLALKGLTAAGAVTKYGVSSGPGTVFSPGTF